MQGDGGGTLVFCTTKAACESGAVLFSKQAPAPTCEQQEKRWWVALDLVAAQASQIHEPLGDVLRYVSFATRLYIHLSTSQPFEMGHRGCISVHI
jgi:hypothetical protein